MNYKMIVVLDKKLQNEKCLSGLYFIIDGTLYVDGTTDSIRHNSHINLFETIKTADSNVMEKYKKHPYLEFPRGILMRDIDSNTIILSGPISLTKNQIEKILRGFKHNVNTKHIFEFDEHYNLDYIMKTIRRKLLKKYPSDIVNYELMEIKEFFTSQLIMF